MLRSITDFDAGIFDELRRMERQMNELFEAWPWPLSIRQGAVRGYPPVNVGITPEYVDVYVFAPGLSPEAFDIALQQNVLTIAGERRPPEEKGQYHLQERFTGAFRRSFTLPEDLDPEQVEARYRDGVLRVRIRRREAVQPRRITVQ